MSSSNRNFPSETTSAKSKFICFLLLLLFPYAGLHRCYVGKYSTGLLMTLTLGGCGIWTLVDLFQLSGGDFCDQDGRAVDEWIMPGVALVVLVVAFGILINVGTLGYVSRVGPLHLQRIVDGELSMEIPQTTTNTIPPATLPATTPTVQQNQPPVNLPKDVFRYTDKHGTVHYVTKNEQIPEEYRDTSEKNPNLPLITKVPSKAVLLTPPAFN